MLKSGHRLQLAETILSNTTIIQLSTGLKRTSIHNYPTSLTQDATFSQTRQPSIHFEFPPKQNRIIDNQKQQQQPTPPNPSPIPSLLPNPVRPSTHTAIAALSSPQNGQCKLTPQATHPISTGHI
ncbi:hypothetical protein T440DRAFT_467851, partial [Plenodomus tracheiphilus IPT5]